jgi:hypothetical protein
MRVFTSVLSVTLFCGLWTSGCAPLSDTSEPPVKRSSTSPTPSDVQTKLAEEVSRGGYNLDAVTKCVASLLAGTGIEYRIDYDAFVRKGIDPAKRQVTHGPVENVARGRLLQQVLDQVPARYHVEGDTLIIVPKP